MNLSKIMKQFVLGSKGLKLSYRSRGKRWWRTGGGKCDLQSSGEKWEKNQRNKDKNGKSTEAKRH